MNIVTTTTKRIAVHLNHTDIDIKVSGISDSLCWLTFNHTDAAGTTHEVAVYLNRSQVERAIECANATLDMLNEDTKPHDAEESTDEVEDQEVAA